MNGVRYAEPIGRAWHRMTAALFGPFDLGRWFALGFSAWLATLTGGAGGSVSLPGERPSANWPALRDQAKELIGPHLTLILVVAGAVLALGFAIWLVLLWVEARGGFMLLANLVFGRAQIAAPWRIYRAVANSLFRWRLVFHLLCLLAFAALAAPALFLLWPLFDGQPVAPGGVAGLTALGILALALGVAAAYVGLFLNDFVMPVMFLHHLTATAAWRRFLSLFRARPGPFLLYGLLMLGLGLTTGFAVIAFGLVTCCCGFILIALPYVGAVVLLPVTVFFRFLGVEFLRQFGPGFDAFTAPPPA